MTSITKLTGNFVETDIDEEIVIMRLDNGEFFSLSDSGATIWRMIDGKRDRNALIAALINDYQADPHQIADQVDEFLLLLKDAGLLA